MRPQDQRHRPRRPRGVRDHGAGMIVVFTQTALTSEVKSVEMNHKLLSEALSCDNIGFNIRSILMSGIISISPLFPMN
jgi:translation elongation factor EF-Tu-like GTPase